ncbi:MAG: dienelactone hydrolase family protein [Candidatus Limnocylindrales bacterium]|jgi:carboxymethylenebutenolidase
MCFDLDSEPPIQAAAGPVVEHEPLILSAADGNRFRAFHARPGTPTGKAIVILPDVRGLHHYYEELALRFAEAGVEAVAIDYFGRTAGIGDRDESFDSGPHVAQTTWAGLAADIVAAAAFLRARGLRTAGTAARRPAIFVTGFCMGGRNAFLSATLGLELAGVIGFYGWPGGPARNDTPAPTEIVDEFACPVLGIFGGADQGIPVPVVQAFRDALTTAGVENEIVVEPDAPHSFFDRKQAEFQAQSDDAWARVRRFIDAHGAV